MSNEDKYPECSKIATLVEENNKLRAQLETAERLALQGGAGHQAIVDKAVGLKNQNAALTDACYDLIDCITTIDCRTCHIKCPEGTNKPIENAKAAIAEAK